MAGTGLKFDLILDLSIQRYIHILLFLHSSCLLPLQFNLKACLTIKLFLFLVVNWVIIYCCFICSTGPLKSFLDWFACILWVLSFLYISILILHFPIFCIFRFFSIFYMFCLFFLLPLYGLYSNHQCIFYWQISHPGILLNYVCLNHSFPTSHHRYY